MPALLNAAQQRALERGGFPAVTISAPGGTKRYAWNALAASVDGIYEGRLLAIGNHTQGLPDREFQLEHPSVEIEVEDLDSTLAILMEGASGNDLGGAAASIQYLFRIEDEAAAFTRFTGIVDSWAFPRAKRCALRLRPNDLVLRRDTPRTLISQSDWPNALPSARGVTVPLAYGKISSSGSGNGIKCIPVDIPGGRWLAAAGHLKAVDAVYNARVLVPTGYSITHPVVNGRTYTLIVFTSPPAADAEITADVQGYEDVGDGSGTLIENPVEQLEHWLENWVYGDYRTGAWLTGQAPISSSHFTTAATFLSDRGHKGARLLEGRPRFATEILNEWAGSLVCRVLWTNTGLLAVKFDNYTLSNIYLDNPWIRWDRDEIGDSFSLRYDPQRLADRVIASYLYDYTEGKFSQILEVRDPTLSQTAPVSMEMPWAYSSV